MIRQRDKREPRKYIVNTQTIKNLRNIQEKQIINNLLRNSCNDQVAKNMSRNSHRGPEQQIGEQGFKECLKRKSQRENEILA